jgi:DNA-binding transcriptional regulator GbsR (MarR family)
MNILNDIMATVSPPPEPVDIPEDEPAVPETLIRFIERFATTLVELGFPRMPARVFTVLLSTDDGRLTAAELAAVLDISPAAVSGAVRYLSQVGLVSRERVPGSRRDHYVLYDDVWYTALVTKDHRLRRLSDQLRTGIDLLGRDTPAGRRLVENLDFFEFVDTELGLMLERWNARRTGQSGTGGSAPSPALD